MIEARQVIRDPYKWRARLARLSERAGLHAPLERDEVTAKNNRALRDLCRVGIPGFDAWRSPAGAKFDAWEARKAIRFFPEFLRHAKGPLAGEPFELAPWQQAVQGNIFGWKRWSEEWGRVVRRFREVFIYIPKKNGKSAWVAGIVLMVMATDGELGAELYSTAASKDQTKHVYEHAVGMIRANPLLAERFQVYGASGGGQQKVIAYPEEGSFYRCLAADADTADGANVHLAANDEIHRLRTDELVDVLRRSTVARAQPLVLNFTTADANRPESTCNRMREYAIKVRDGTGGVDDPSFLPVIYEAPEKARWRSRKTWYLANPNLGVSIQESDIAAECARAQHQPSELNKFLRLRLNRITNTELAAFPAGAWEKCTGRLALEDLDGEACHGGLDLSSRIDLTAFALWFPEHDAGILRFWIPRETALEAEERDRAPYLTWAREGIVTLTEGSAIDYEHVEADIMEMIAPYRCVDAAYDDWNCEATRQRLEAAGLPMFKFVQGLRSYNEPCKELERLVIAGELEHFGNGCLAWCASNLMWKKDHSGNMMPDKKKSTGRIDGISALAMAIGRSIAREVEPVSAYDGGEEGLFL